MRVAKLRNRLFFGGGLVLAGIVGGVPALAAPEPSLRLETQEPTDTVLDQVTSVSQLTDVKPTDWAFQALRSLVERYGCIVGYPDKTYRGNRALSRFEFAAGLNACLNRVSELLASSTADLVRKEDLAALQKLQEQFAAELTALRGKVDSLEARTATLEAQQFSTTTRLNVLSSFNLTQAFSQGNVRAEGFPVPNTAPATRVPVRLPFLNPSTGGLATLVTKTTQSPSAVFSNSTYVILSSSFTGRDVLTTILAAGNGNPPGSVYSSAGFTSTFGVPYAESNPVTPQPASSVGLFELKYSFPIGESVTVVVGPRILPFRHFDQNPFTNVVTGASGLNSYQSTLANGGLSGAGAIASWTITPDLTLQVGYLARNDASFQFFNGDAAPNPLRGLFKGSYSILAELDYSPASNVNLRLIYNRAHIQSPPLSTLPLPFPFSLTYSVRGVVDDGFGGRLRDIDSDNFVFNFDWTVAPNLALFGRYSYSISGIDPVNPFIKGGSVWLQAIQAGLAFPDVGTKGALGTIAVIVPFDVLSGRRFLAGGYGNGGTEIDVEATYFFPLSTNVAIVPTFYAVFNPNNFDNNPPVFSAVLRTQFIF